jgi:hypothetical protein
MRYSSFRAWARIPALVLSVLLAVTIGSAADASQPDSQSTTMTASAPASDPMYGNTVYPSSGENYHEAYLREKQAYGGSLDAVRMFFRGLPQSWSSIIAKVGHTPVVVSFKSDPAAVVAGRYDAQLRQWFAEAPTGRPTFWSYWHEPEDDSVSPAAYRAAWRHIARLADRAGNAELRSTMILMCWTLSPKSGRDWHNYYPGNDVIDVMAFDCYNTGRRNGVYKDPSAILAPVVAAAQSAGKPWAIAEFGSNVVETDGGEQGRATWIRQFADYVRDHGGVFATYFDSLAGFDYRLHDATSRNAWRDVVQTY